MSGVTTWRGYPIPTAGDEPNGLDQITDLATAVDLDVAQLDLGYRLAAEVYITSTGSFAKAVYPGIKAVEVECLGGGGGSGGVPSTNSLQRSISSGGSGGEYTRAWIIESDLSATETVTIGAAGAGGTTGSSDFGGTGGTTSFGALLTALGGNGGIGGSNPTASDIDVGANLPTSGGTGADFAIPGSPGEWRILARCAVDGTALHGRRRGWRLRSPDREQRDEFLL